MTRITPTLQPRMPQKVSLLLGASGVAVQVLHSLVSGCSASQNAASVQRRMHTRKYSPGGVSAL